MEKQTVYIPTNKKLDTDNIEYILSNGKKDYIQNLEQQLAFVFTPEKLEERDEILLKETKEWMDYFIHLFKNNYIVFDDATNLKFKEFIKTFQKL